VVAGWGDTRKCYNFSTFQVMAFVFSFLIFDSVVAVVDCLVECLNP